MAWALVQQKVLQGAGATFNGTPSATVTPDTAPANGNFFLIATTPGIRTFSSLTNNGGGGLTSDTVLAEAGGGAGKSCLIFGLIAGSPTTLTVNISGNNVDDPELGYFEFSGPASDVLATEVSSVTYGTSVTPHDVGPVTPANAVALFVGWFIGGHITDDWTQATGPTLIDIGNAPIASISAKLGYFIQASATAQEWTSDSSVGRDHTMIWAAFKGEAVGSSLTLPWLPRQTNLSGPTGAQMIPSGMTPPSRPA